MHQGMPIGRRLVAAVGIVVAVAACGSGNGAGPSGGRPSGGATSRPSPDLSSAPPSGTVGAGALALDVSNGIAGAAVEDETATLAAGRARVGLAALLGPDGPTLAAAVDRGASDLLWGLVSDAGASQATTGFRLAVFHVSGGPVAAALPQPGTSLLGPWAAAMMIVDSSAGSFSAYAKSDHAEDTVALGPNSGTITTDTTVSVTPNGSRLVVDVQLKTKGEVSDNAGHLVFRINGTGHAHVEVQGCPDTRGMSTATMEFSSSEDYFVASEGASSGHSWHQDDKADAKIFADSEAHLDHSTLDLTSEQAIRGGTRAAGASQSDLTNSTIGTTESMTLAPNGGVSAAAGTFTATSVTRADVDEAYRSAEKLVALAVYTTATAAEKFWRSGKCIEVVVDPNGGEVAADSPTNVTVKVRHRFDGNELDKPVEATLSGTKSIEPTGRRLPAPAQFTYVAGPKSGDVGNVTFKSVSNRGIGQTTVRFTVGGSWTADHSNAGQSTTGQKCGGLDGVWRVDGLAENAQVRETATWIATLDGTSLTGTYTYKSVGTVKGADVVTTATGSGRASAVLQSDGTLLMTLGAMTADSVVVGAGTRLEISVPVPAHPFTWTPGGTCPP